MTAPTQEKASQQRRPMRPDWFAVAAALCAVAAPASLTGHNVIDAIERALIAGVVTYVGAHGRRWAWIAAGALVAISASGVSLVLAMAGLAVLVAGAWPKRRSRVVGAVGVGLSMNAALWYPTEAGLIAPVLAAVAALILIASGYPHLRAHRRTFVRRGLWAIAAITVVAVGTAGAAMAIAYGHVQTGSDEAQVALEAARDGEGDVTFAQLDSAQEEFDQAASSLDGFMTMPAKLVPGLSQQVHAVEVTVDQGKNISDTGEDLAASAEYDELQYRGQLDLQQVVDLAGPTRRADAALAAASDTLDELSNGSLLPPLRERIDLFAEQIDDARRDTALAADLLETTPPLFGSEGDRRYLIIFITPAELRGAGGFIGSWAELTFVDGDITLSESGRISDLIFAVPPGTRTISGPEDYLTRYGRFQPQDFLQDATFSPNFPSSAQVIAELYGQSGRPPVDGVIAVDPTGLAALLELSGPVEVDGLLAPLTSDNAVPFLTKDQYTLFSDDDAREAVLTEAIRATFQQLIDGSLPAPRTLADTLSGPTRAGHLRLWSPEDAEQALFERLGADGTLVIPDGSDGFSVVQQNSGNNKLDAYLQRSISYEAVVDDETGALTATMQIELTNNAPGLDLPPAVVGNTRGAPIGTNVSTLTVHTPHAVVASRIDGEERSLGPSEEVGLPAWDTPLIEIPPGETVTVVLELQGVVDLSNGYELRILPQPVANPDLFSVFLAGDGSQEADVDTLAENEPLEAPTTLSAPTSP